MSTDLKTSLIISIRETGNGYSTFVDVNKLLKTNDIDLIYSTYQSILKQIHLFEPSKLEQLEALETRLFQKLEHSKCQAEALRIHSSFQHYLGEIKASYLPKENEVVAELEELKKARLPTASSELRRLRQNRRIDSTLARVGKVFEDNDDLLVAYAHSIELREKLKDKYFVINHGQPLFLLIVNMVAKKLKQLFEPHQHENCEVLRHDVFLKEIQDKDTKWFSDQIKEDSKLTDMNFSDVLISGDCYLESTLSMESAVDFFKGSTTAYIGIQGGRKKFVTSLLEKIFSHYFPDPEIRKTLIQEMLGLMDQYLIDQEGVLFSICIPKEHFNTVAHLSRALGYTIDESKYTYEHIESFQNGIGPDSDSTLPYESYAFIGMEKTAPQVRILPHKLQTTPGVLVQAHSTLAQETMNRMERTIERLIHAARCLRELPDRGRLRVLYQV